MLLFAYGTLLDPDVRTLVLGRPSPAAEAVPAVLRGYRRVRVAEEVYPTVLPDPAAIVHGALVPLLDAVERDRVQFFEGFELILREREVQCSRRGPVGALVCTATDTIRHTDEDWSLEDWQRLHKADYLPASSTYMDGFGTLDISQVHRVWLATGRGTRSDDP